MCTKKHWDQCMESPAYHEAKAFALELQEYAKKIGIKGKTIRIRNKEQIIKGGYGKADAQVVWLEGPENWALDFTCMVSNTSTYCIAENGHTVSFYKS